MESRPRTADAIAAHLRALGVAIDDVVMVHASLRAIGPVEGGADGVIDAMRLALGGSGTMLMVLGARDDHAWVNARPESERPALLHDAVPFDASSTPADPDMGVLAEVFRRRPETQVNDHPEARFGAAGSAARALLDEAPWDDYFGPGSPLQRLIAADGKVLRLGGESNTVTALHHAEYRCAVDPKRRVRRHRLVATPSGPRIRVVECLDDEEGIVDYGGEDYFADILRDYLETDRVRTGFVGDARSELIDAADIVDFGTRWMDEHLVSPTPPDPPMARLRPKLDTDLLAARRQRDAHAVAAIRSLMTALANAEAVPVEERPHELVKGSADVARRELRSSDVEAAVSAEIAERQRAIEEYRAIGADSAGLERERDVLERYREAP